MSLVVDVSLAICTRDIFSCQVSSDATLEAKTIQMQMIFNESLLYVSERKPNRTGLQRHFGEWNYLPPVRVPLPHLLPCPRRLPRLRNPCCCRNSTFVRSNPWIKKNYQHKAQGIPKHKQMLVYLVGFVRASIIGDFQRRRYFGIRFPMELVVFGVGIDRRHQRDEL